MRVSFSRMALHATAPSGHPDGPVGGLREVANLFMGDPMGGRDEPKGPALFEGLGRNGERDREEEKTGGYFRQLARGILP